MRTIYQYLAMGQVLNPIYYDTSIGKDPNPIFIPRKHPKLKYADHKRMKAKRKNKLI